jgi:AcrR family transcriptional regulator
MYDRLSKPVRCDKFHRSDQDGVVEDGAVTEQPGRREAHKRATTAALRDAAARLIAERGYEATTVRDVARCAGVTERTFYRYFDGKEGLVAEEYHAWLATLQEAIASQPGDLPPFAAIREGLLSSARRRAESGPLLLLSGLPTLAGLRQSSPRPLQRLETAIAEAIKPRLRAAAAASDGAAESAEARSADADDEFRAQVIARAATSALRSAIIWYRDQLGRGRGARATTRELLDRAFAILADEARREPEADSVVDSHRRAGH